MHQVGDAFMELMLKAGFGRDLLFSADQTVIGLWPDFRLAFLNEGWFRFASENRGEPAISRDWPLGRSILECLPEPLTPFYLEGFRQALQTCEPWGHDYECSSPTRFRLFHQQVFPLGNAQGYLTFHSLSEARPIAETESKGKLDVDTFLSDGVLRQCCHCRKFRTNADDGWTWIGAWVGAPPAPVSHGICPPCWDFHYPGIRPVHS